MKANKTILVLMVLALFFVAGCANLPFKPGTQQPAEVKKITELPKFGSCQAMADEIEKARKESESRGGLFETVYNIASGFGGMQKMAASEASIASAPSAGADYSQTNVQVEGVDEADIVKTDGQYIYLISNNKLIIAKAYPSAAAKVLSIEQFQDFYPQEIFIEGDKVLVFGSRSYSYPYETTGGGVVKKVASSIMPMPPYRSYMSLTSVRVYDTKDKENPQLAKTWEFEGSYVSSRKIDEWVYFVVNDYPHYSGPKPLPEELVPLYREFKGEASSEDKFQPVASCVDIQYIEPIRPQNFITVAAVSMKDTDEKLRKEVIMGSGQNIYASLDNLYVAQTWWDYRYGNIPEELGWSSEKTIIYKFELNDGKINYKTNGQVPGTILNQFSMDEYKGNFRIATTAGQVSREGGGSTNNVYILDDDLDVTGKLEGLAPGERIYSARFMGDRGYLVTFKKIDPLFAIDLKDPKNPKVLGKLKIPGYSDYLHPYDENHIIGVGKETVEAEEGDFAWYQGIKMAIFDVSDVENPKQLHKVLIGDRGTDSPVLQNHKAFLFDKERKLLVIPVLVAQIKDKENLEQWSYGEYIYQGAYVFNIDLDKGFVLKGKITHYDDDEAFKKSGYYFGGGDKNVERSLFIDGILYTISNARIQLNDLNDLSLIKKLELKEQPVEEENGEIIY